MMSLVSLPLGTFYEILYFQDYWNPASILSFNLGPVRILLEDFMFSFAMIGISSVIYRALSRKDLVKIEKPVNSLTTFAVIFVINAVVILSLFFLGLNSIFATSVAGLILAVYMIIRRRDLLVNSLFSGLAVMGLMFLVYFVGFRLTSNTEEIFQQIWFLYDQPLGLRFLGVPLTEMVYGFATGVCIGSLYKFVRSRRLV